MSQAPRIDTIEKASFLDSAQFGLVAGESITAGDAICLTRATMAAAFEIFKTDLSDIKKVRSFIGFAAENASIGQSVKFHRRGFLNTFSGLTAGDKIFLSGIGLTTQTPTAGSIEVGHAITATVAFINDENGYVFDGNQIMVKSHGSSDPASNPRTSSQTSSEHYDFVSWSAGTADGTARVSPAYSNMASMGFHHAVDGQAEGAASASLYSSKYDKTSWASFANRSAAKAGSGAGEIGGDLYVCTGWTGNLGGTPQTVIDRWNGTGWTNGVANFTNATQYGTWLDDSDLIHTANTAHETFDGVSTAVVTAPPAGGLSGTGVKTANDRGIAGTIVATTTTYEWDGAAWSGVLAMATMIDAGGAGAQNTAVGFDPNGGTSYANGGALTGLASTNITQDFVSPSWSGGTSSSDSRTNHIASVF